MNNLLGKIVSSPPEHEIDLNHIFFSQHNLKRKHLR